MLTPAFVGSLIFGIRGKVIHELKQLSLFLAVISGFIVVCCGIFYYGFVLGTTPEDFAKANASVQYAQEELDSLVANFEYSPEKGDTEDKLHTFVSRYNILADEIETEKRNLESIKSMLDKDNFWTHTIPKIMLDFGLVEKIIELIR